MQKTKLQNFLSILFAIFIALMIRTIIFEPYSIPSGSMKPNFLIGDYLLVSKYRYGVSKASIPFFAPDVMEGRIADIYKPQRGEVIVFKSPHEGFTNYIKRLIGLPGDKIQVIKGILYINDVMVERVKSGEFIDTDGSKLTQYKETLPNAVSYYVLDNEKDDPWDNTQVYYVPKDHYFFMGDNRDHSVDSRFGARPIGFVPYDRLIGRAEIIIFSNPESIIDVVDWIKSFNFNRFFIMVK